MAARADILGRHRRQSPGQLGRRPGRRRPARDRDPVRARRRRARAGPPECTTSWWPGATGCAVCRVLDLNATPPFNYAHDHFGFRDRLSQPVIEGSGEEPTPGSGAPLKPASSSSAIPTRTARRQSAAAGGAVAQRKLHGLPAAAGARRRCSATICASTPTRRTSRSCWPRSSWAAGAAAPRWCWHRTRTIPSWARTPCATTTSTTRRWIRTGMPCPLGSHARRLNPRDTAHNMNRRRMIRRGATYGPALPEGAPDDGVDRGIAAFIICASLVRQFEFAQNVWINDQHLPRTRQRARPDLRNPGRHTGIQDSEAADPQSPQGSAGVHHADGRGVLLPARHQRHALPRGAATDHAKDSP